MPGGRVAEGLRGQGWGDKVTAAAFRLSHPDM